MYGEYRVCVNTKEDTNISEFLYEALTEAFGDNVEVWTLIEKE